MTPAQTIPFPKCAAFQFLTCKSSWTARKRFISVLPWQSGNRIQYTHFRTHNFIVLAWIQSYYRNQSEHLDGSNECHVNSHLSTLHFCIISNFQRRNHFNRFTNGATHTCQYGAEKRHNARVIVYENLAINDIRPIVKQNRSNDNRLQWTLPLWPHLNEPNRLEKCNFFRNYKHSVIQMRNFRLIWRDSSTNAASFIEFRWQSAVAAYRAATLKLKCIFSRREVGEKKHTHTQCIFKWKQK